MADPATAPADDALANDQANDRHHAHRTWPQRASIGGALAVAVICFVGAGGLFAGQQLVERRSVTAIVNPASDTTSPPVVVPATDESGQPLPTTETTVPATFPQADPGAKNFLVTGADNNSCVDPDSPFAPSFGDRSDFGERSDTIMMWRVDPGTSQVAVLSFPRDLWVTIAGTRSKQRINSAYRRDEPQKLIDTIYDNFGIVTDHWIQVDFCAFKTLVDAVGGVEVPFEFPARDPNTGLDVPTTGCFEFSGEHALAYVRSRHYEYEDPPGSGDWREDGTSDLGRISRQQDFLRRVVSSVLSKGAFNPTVVRGLINTSLDDVVTDDQLSVARLLEFAGTIKNVDPTAISTYQIESRGVVIAGQAVLDPRLGGDSMESILAVFRGQAALAGAPEQVFEPTTSSVPRPTHNATSTTTADDDAGTATTTTLPTVNAEENAKGIVPPRDVAC